MAKKYTATSAGWLAFFSIIYGVLLTVFAVSLGLALTLGEPAKLSGQLTSQPALGVIEKDANRVVTKTVTDAGIALPDDAELVPTAALKEALNTGVHAAAKMNLTYDYSAFTKKVATHTEAVVAEGGKPLTTKQKTALTTALEKMMAKHVRTEVMQQGYGTVYGFVALTLETAAIVCGILGALCLLIMGKSSHSWRRFLVTFGRITYIIGFVGGIAALVVAVPSIAGSIHFGDLHPEILQTMITGFAGTWQTVAGVVILVGLLTAAVGHLFRGPSGEKTEAAAEA
ncbi:hypothetical protein [Lacticaseibacillus yichunensis]|uniref:Uncharacterized protein n=1 Tax=Lacticaseibacillus yichunensis TaxID=2486015 RepID=A0ABW4CTX3_9LACO|nr:hypothetical protein [Lacticaseibacillus yichunensis]